jgi:hypothetical protein
MTDAFDPYAHHHVDDLIGHDAGQVDLDPHSHAGDLMEPDRLYYDRNGDGRIDTVYEDLDRDGRIDEYTEYPLHDGELTMTHTSLDGNGLGDAIDRDGDGDMDRIVLDAGSSGRSVVLDDTDGDHVVDTRSLVNLTVNDHRHI